MADGIRGGFTAQGWVEMAWMMGFIKHHTGPLSGSRDVYCGWVDAGTNQPVDDMDVQVRYGKQILEHTGIRVVEPALCDGYDPHKKQVCQEISLREDLPAFEATQDQAALV